MEVVKKAVWAFKNNCLNLIDKEIERTQTLPEDSGFLSLTKNRLLLTLKGLKKNIQSLPTDPKTLITSYHQRFNQRKKSKPFK